MYREKKSEKQRAWSGIEITEWRGVCGTENQHPSEDFGRLSTETRNSCQYQRSSETSGRLNTFHPWPYIFPSARKKQNYVPGGMHLSWSAHCAFPQWQHLTHRGCRFHLTSSWEHYDFTLRMLNFCIKEHQTHTPTSPRSTESPLSATNLCIKDKKEREFC